MVNCGICYSEIENESIKCPKCKTSYHKECLKNNKFKCNQFDCETEIEINDISNANENTNIKTETLNLENQNKPKENKLFSKNTVIYFLLTIIILLLYLNLTKSNENKEIKISSQISPSLTENNKSDLISKDSQKTETTDKNIPIESISPTSEMNTPIESVSSTPDIPIEITPQPNNEKLNVPVYKELLNINDISYLDCWALLIKRNEIYARYGKRFKTKEIREHFENESWYKVNPNYKDSLVSSLDLRNAGIILKEEKQRNCW